MQNLCKIEWIFGIIDDKPVIKITYWVKSLILIPFRCISIWVPYYLQQNSSPIWIWLFSTNSPLLFCYFYLRVLLFNSFIENIFLLSHFFVSMCLCKILHRLSKVLHNLSKVLHNPYGKHYNSSFTLPSHIYL